MTRRVICLICWLALCLATPAQAATENLLHIYELALANDPQLQSAEASFGAASTIKRQALARLLPQLDADYRYSGSTSSSDSHAETYSVSLNQSLFNLSAFFGYKQSLAVADQASLQFDIEHQQLVLRVTESYFDVLRAKDNLTSALAEEKAIAQQLEQTRQRYDVGLTAITDVHEAQAAYDLAIANRLTLEVSVGIAQEQLASITGQSHSSLQNLSSDFPISKPDPADIDQWIEFAQNNNISIQIGEQLVEQANQNAKVKTSSLAPSVNAALVYSDSDNISLSSNAALVDNEKTVFELKIEVPLYAGGARYAERKQAGFERVAEQANLVATKRKVIQSVRSNYLTTVTDTSRVKARQRAITSALSALDATQAGYDAGTRNIVDLLNAQRDLFRAQRDYANSRYDYIVNSLNLKFAAGLIGPQDIAEINKWLRP